MVKNLIKKIFNWQTLVQLFKFGAVGIVNTVVDVGLFWLLKGVFQDIPAEGSAFLSFINMYYYTAAQTVSYLVAVLCSYFLNKHWTFAAKRQNTGTTLVKMYVLSGINFLLMQGMLWFWIDVAGAGMTDFKLFGLSWLDWDTIAKLFATVPITVLNFLGSKFWVFREKKGQSV